MPKDKKALFLYIITSLVLWQLGVSIRNICISDSMQALTADDPYISLVYLKNTGGAFSMFQSHTTMLIVFGILVLLGILIYVFKCVEFKDKTTLLFTIILSAGVLGNLAERLENGFVVDFIQLNFINFAVFNFFDVLISFSIFFYVMVIIFDEIKKFFNKKREE